MVIEYRESDEIKMHQIHHLLPQVVAEVAKNTWLP